MIFCKRKVDVSLVPKLTCGVNEIELVPEFKYLGVIFDSHLTFKSHFNYVLKRVASAVGCLLSLKRLLNLNVFKILLNSFVFSIIDYALPIWGTLSKTDMGILQSKVNSLLGAFFYPSLCNNFNRYIKIALSKEGSKLKPIKINYRELWEKCNILSVCERLNYFSGVFAFKAIRLNHIPEIHDQYTFIHNTHNQTLSLPQYNTTFAQKSIFYQSALLWNTFSNDLKQTDISLQKFKGILNWLILQRLGEFVSH